MPRLNHRRVVPFRARPRDRPAFAAPGSRCGAGSGERERSDAREAGGPPRERVRAWKKRPRTAAPQGTEASRPAKLVLAVPVALRETVSALGAKADEVTRLATPERFGRVGRGAAHSLGFQTTRFATCSRRFGSASRPDDPRWRERNPHAAPAGPHRLASAGAQRSEGTQQRRKERIHG